MTPAELFAALHPWAHRIADTQRALLYDRDTPHQPLNTPHGPVHWHDPAHIAAQKWANNCTLYLTHNHPAMWGTAYRLTMTWPQHWETITQLDHNRPAGLTQQVLDGALHRAGLRHTNNTLETAQGAQIKCAQPGCTGIISIGSARCRTCHASFKTAMIYRCQHDECDHILDQNQITTGLCATHRNQQRTTPSETDTGCISGRRHRLLDTGDGHAICDRCKRRIPITTLNTI